MTPFVSLDGPRLATGEGTATWIAGRPVPGPLLSFTDAQVPGRCSALTLFDIGGPDARPLETAEAGRRGEAMP